MIMIMIQLCKGMDIILNRTTNWTVVEHRRIITNVLLSEMTRS